MKEVGGGVCEANFDLCVVAKMMVLLLSLLLSGPIRSYPGGRDNYYDY